MADVVNLGNIQIANAVSVVYTAGDNISISDDRVISAIVPTKTSDLLNDSGYITNDTDELVNYTTTSQLNTLLSEKANANDVYTKIESDNKYSTIPETGNKIEVSIDSTTYIMSLRLKDKNNNILSTAEVDLPLESVVVNGRYDDTTKELILTLQNGNEVRISVADLISGLQETLIAGNNIQINDNVISATDTTYTAGTNVTITGTTISAKDTTYTLSGSTTGDITTLTLTDSDSGTSTATVDMSKYQNEIDFLGEIIHNLPHVSGENTELSLSPTMFGPLESTLKGNTEQTTYTGKNLFNKSNVNVLDAYFNTGTTNTITSSNSAKTIYIQCKPSTTYTISKITSARFYVGYTETTPAIGVEVFGRDGSNDLTTPITITTGNNATYLVAFVYITSVDTLTPQQIYDTIQIEESATATTYEPYVGGVPSPNPLYPQKVKVVTGDNTIRICNKNLLEGIVKGEINVNTGAISTSSTANAWICTNKIKYDNTKTYYASVNGVQNSFALNLRFYNKNDEYIGYSTLTGSGSNFAITSVGTVLDTTPDYFMFRTALTSFSDENEKAMVSTSSNLTYEPYKEQEYHLYLGGNVFDLSDVEENKSITASGGYVGTSSVSNLSGYTPVVSGLEYRLTYDYTSLLNTSNRSMCYYDKDKVFIRGNGYVPASKNQTFIMPENAKYVRFSYDKNCTDISFSTDATPIELCKLEDYQDYIFKQDGKWYKHNVIGTKIFTGQESWNYSAVTQGSLFRYANMSDNLKVSTYAPYSYYYKGIKSSNSSSRANYQFYLQSGNNFTDFIDNRFTNADDFKDWLTTHNVKIYYVLATPTAVEITNQTLIDQLNAIEKATSYKTQTNISSMYNTDNAQMIISASALYDLSALIGA